LHFFKFCCALQKDVKSKQLLNAFLQRHTSQRKFEEGIEDNLRRAKFSLDNTILRQKKVKKQTVRRRGLSRKELKKLTKINPDDAM
jgi:hypothetical protein